MNPLIFQLIRMLAQRGQGGLAQYLMASAIPKTEYGKQVGRASMGGTPLTIGMARPGGGQARVTMQPPQIQATRFNMPVSRPLQSVSMQMLQQPKRFQQRMTNFLQQPQQQIPQQFGLGMGQKLGSGTPTY